MSEATTWALVGPGNIGTEIQRQLGQDYVAERLNISPAPDFVIRSSGIVGPYSESVNGQGETLADIDDKYLPDVLFVAIPSSNDGNAAKDYISHMLERDKLVVTAEKGAMANHFEELREKSGSFARLGVNATVGGGTRVLDVARQYSQDPGNITQIHLALNGTLSAIMSLVAPPAGSGMSLGQAVHQAVELGYAEPGSETPHDVIKGEAEGDIPKKTSIFFNKTELSEKVLDWADVSFELSRDDIDRTIEEANIRRFIVSMYSPAYLDRTSNCGDRDIIGGFNVEHDGWRLIGGFQNVGNNPLFSHMANITGPGNAMVIGLGPDETDGVYSVSGPGAGVRPTVNTMLDDFVSRRHLINTDSLLKSV